jgi:hypothetical protein
MRGCGDWRESQASRRVAETKEASDDHIETRVRPGPTGNRHACLQLTRHAAQQRRRLARVLAQEGAPAGEIQAGGAPQRPRRLARSTPHEASNCAVSAGDDRVRRAWLRKASVSSLAASATKSVAVRCRFSIESHGEWGDEQAWGRRSLMAVSVIGGGGTRSGRTRCAPGS